MRLPTNTRVTFPYGATTAPYTIRNPHAGTDYGYSLFHPSVYAPEDLTITFTGDLGACGTAINATGSDGRTYRFCHLHSLSVSIGQQVPEGTKIARIGDTGFAFGKHLHFVMWVNGQRVDPDATIKSLIEKEEDMVTTFGVNVLWRLYYGDTPTQADLDRYVGKITFDELGANIRKGDRYKKRTAGIKNDKAGHRYDAVNDHLPTSMR